MKIPPPWGIKTGVEYYVLNLAENLILIDKDNEYIFFICFSIGSKMDSKPFWKVRIQKRRSLDCQLIAYYACPGLTFLCRL